jgi:RNA polymerase sigma-70 factor (ECF subfamily)
MDEADLQAVNGVLGGDGDAFEHLVSRYQHVLFDLALNLLGSAEEAEDAVQCAFIKIYSNLADFDQKRSFMNWAYTITLNISRNRLRRRQLLSFIPFISRSEDTDGGGGYAAEPEERGASPDLQLSAGILRKDLGQAVSKLPLDLRAPFVLFHIHRRPAKEVAEIMGLTPNAVSIRLFRARERLVKDLAPKYQEQFSAADGLA